MALLLFYVDPGSGMMLLQVLLAFVASVLFYFRKFFYKLFGKDKNIDSPTDGGKGFSESARKGKNEG